MEFKRKNLLIFNSIKRRINKKTKRINRLLLNFTTNYLFKKSKRSMKNDPWSLKNVFSIFVNSCLHWVWPLTWQKQSLPFKITTFHRFEFSVPDIKIKINNTFMRPGAEIQTSTFGIISLPPDFFTNFMNSAPTIRYATSTEKKLFNMKIL